MTITKIELGKMTKQQLCDYCRSHKIKGYSGKTKQQRIDLIINYYKDKSLPSSTKKPSKEQKTKRMVKIKDFDRFFDWFKYNLAKDLKLAYMNDWRKNEDLKTGKEYIEIFKDYDFEKVKNKLQNISNLKYVKDDRENYRIYLK